MAASGSPRLPRGTAANRCASIPDSSRRGSKARCRLPPEYTTGKECQLIYADVFKGSVMHGPEGPQLEDAVEGG